MRRKIQGDFLHATNCKFVSERTNVNNRRQTQKKKTKGEEREFTKISENYKEFCRVLLWLQSLGFNVAIRSQPPFLMDKELYLYPPELSSWVWISRSRINAWFAHYDLLVTAQITPLACRIIMQRYLSQFITAHIDIGALQHLKSGDDMAA